MAAAFLRGKQMKALDNASGGTHIASELNYFRAQGVFIIRANSPVPSTHST